jgi:type II secretory pathway component PulF
MIAGIFFVSAMVVLSLTIYQSASLTWSLPEMFLVNISFQQHRNILLGLFTIIILASQGFFMLNSFNFGLHARSICLQQPLRSI